MIEINGHLVDEREISYISPIKESSWHSFNFSIVVDTEFVLLEFKEEEAAIKARQTVVVIRSNLND